MAQGQYFLKKSTTGLNSKFSFNKTGYHINVKDPNQPYYLHAAGKRTVGFSTFPKVLVLCEI